MQKFFKELFTQFKVYYQGLTPTRRVAAILSLVIIFTTTTFLLIVTTKRAFVPLFKNVPGDQLPIIVSKLKEKNIPFEIKEDGNTVMVPPQYVSAMQMSIMAEAGSAKIGNIGLELFSKQDLGTTSYVQKINFQRAMQGELTRAINTLEVVKNSKVILALPTRKAFLEEGDNAKASVVVELYPGKALTPAQVRGITYLVSSSIKSLDPDNVTVVNSRGKVLNKNSGSAAANVSNEMIELKDRTEAQLEERIESILAKVVGQGNVIARVNATINMKDMSAIEEVVDPDKTAVRSVQSEEEGLNGSRTNTVGVPGSRANLPGAEDAGEVGFRQNVSKGMKITNYEVPKTVRNIKEAPGRVEQLSVAVLVDGQMKNVKGEDGSVTKEWVPRSEEELKKYEDLVKSAVGFATSRGDTIKIENIKFKKEDFSESTQILTQLERRKVLSYLIKWSVIGLSLALFFFLVLRPFMRWITESFQETVDDILPKTIEELEELQTVETTLPGMSSALPMIEDSLDPDKAESELLRDRIMGLIDKDDRKAANALGLWLVRRDT